MVDNPISQIEKKGHWGEKIWNYFTVIKMEKLTVKTNSSRYKGIYQIFYSCDFQIWKSNQIFNRLNILLNVLENLIQKS